MLLLVDPHRMKDQFIGVVVPVVHKCKSGQPRQEESILGMVVVVVDFKQVLGLLQMGLRLLQLVGLPVQLA